LDNIVSVIAQGIATAESQYSASCADKRPDSGSIRTSLPRRQKITSWLSWHGTLLWHQFLAHFIGRGAIATFGYGRVSTGQQTADDQFVEITQAGYEVEPEFWFADQGVSGKVCAEQRPAFKRLLGQMRNGETLVVSKPDRLGATRSTCCRLSGIWASVASGSSCSNSGRPI
jgi:hypothetical protein